MTEPYKVCGFLRLLKRLSVAVSGGRIVGIIVLETIRISASFELLSCAVEGLSARYATFSKWLRLEGAPFRVSLVARDPI